MKTRKQLTHAVLTSTLFVSQLSHADIITVTKTTQQNTSTQNNFITIAPSGQIVVGTIAENAILVDSDNAIITIDPVNTHGQEAIFVTPINGNGLNGIAVGDGAGKGLNARILINPSSGITVLTRDGIFIDASGTTLINSGTILGNQNAIEISSKGTNANIINNDTGVIKATGLGSDGILVAGLDSTITNSGLIQGGTGNGRGISYRQPFLNLDNRVGGIISSNGDAIFIDGGGNGNITNSGTITSLEHAININNVFNGVITNNIGGLIQTKGPAASTISIVNTFNKIENHGTIQSINAPAIKIAGTAGGIITNDGIIKTVLGPAIFLGDDSVNTIIDGIENSGTIVSTNLAGGVIVAKSTLTLTNGIINSGDITNLSLVVGSKAIDLQPIGKIVDAKLIQTAGTITGDVYLASKGGSVLDMTGGKIIGNVFGSDNADIINITGGIITGTLNTKDGGDTITISKAILQDIIAGAGDDTINFESGSFGALAGGTGKDTLNINGNLTTQGLISNIETINLNKASIFTVNNLITGLDTQLSLGAGTSLFANKNITGTGAIENKGLLSIGNNVTVQMAGLTTNTGTLTINPLGILDTGDFVQLAPGSFNPVISGLNAGNILVTNKANLGKGSFVAPQIGSGQFIAAGAKYDVITTVAGVNDLSDLVQPNSLIFSFNKAVVNNGNTLQLTVERAPFVEFAPNEPVSGVADALDQIIAEGPTGDFITLIGQLDTLTTKEALQDSLSTLTPITNGSIALLTGASISQAYSTMQRRLETLRDLWPLDEIYNYGDGYVYAPPVCNDSRGFSYNSAGCGTPPPAVILEEPLLLNNNTWIAGYGSLIKQRARDPYPGYHANSVAYAIGSDYRISDQVAAGLAFNYTRSKSESEDTLGDQDVEVNSYQGTFYGYFNPFDPAYIDLMFSVSSHSYQTNRQIVAGTFSAQAHGEFHGFQYGVQAEFGYPLVNGRSYFVPIMRFRYANLDLDSYTEEGAGDLDLAIRGVVLEEVVGGVGFRYAYMMEYGIATYVPEFSAMVLYDFANDPHTMISNFTGQGPLFTTVGVSPSRTSYLFGLGINAVTADHYTFKLKYELDFRDQYFSNSGYLQLYYNW